VIAAGVTRVVFAQEDPNPKVSGGGSAQLSAAGITVESGLLEEKAEWINRGFLKRMRSGLPWLCLKIAASLDGKIADGDGNSRWVTGAASLQHVHQLRDKFDAVLVGSNTLQQDDPELTVREVVGRDPIRIAIDRKLMVGSDSRFMNTQTEARTLILCGTGAPLDRCAAMPDGCECVIVPEHADGQLMLKQALQKIAEEGINTVLCEGGGKLAGSLLREGLVDEVYWVVAPVVLGELGRPSVDLAGKIVAIGDAQRFERLDSFVLGDDQWLHLKVQR
jgi:diaminohydroxyphosphoribosylaminopyrimidine deaminase/5-amino-6-(5-phosphoribosylamino)uracil reductase